MADEALFTNAPIDTTERYIKDDTTNSCLAISTGKVGIGTNSPGTNLEIYGTWVSPKGALYVNCPSDHGYVAVNAPSNRDGGYLWDKGGAGKWVGYVPANSDDLRFNEFGVGDRLTIKTGGNVGIGCTDPGSKLQVNGNAAIGYSANTAGPSNGLAVSGNVGIGTTNPAALLELSKANGDPAIIFDIGNTDKFSLGVDDDDNDKFKISGGGTLGTNDRLVIDSTGMVGIGTSNPSEKLHIYSTGAPKICLQNASDNLTIDITKIESSSYLLLWGHNGVNLASNGTIADLIVDSDHDVSIANNLSVGATLDVNGNIKASGYLVGSDAGIDATINYQKYPSGNGTLVFKKGILTSAT